MNYITIYTTRNKNEEVVIEQFFRQRQIDYRILKAPISPAVPEGAKVQVVGKDVERAKNVLKENGILGRPQPAPESKQTTGFWWYFLFVLLAVIVASVLINWFWD